MLGYVFRLTLFRHLTNSTDVPLFSLEVGKDYKLHIPVIDNDGDQVHCDISRYVEAKGFNAFIDELDRSKALSVDNKVRLTFISSNDRNNGTALFVRGVLQSKNFAWYILYLI